MKLGDFVVIKKQKDVWKGKIIQKKGRYLTLKLDSGYNIGILIDKNTKVKIIKKSEIKKHKPIKFEIKFDEKKPLVSILSAGGTIASSIDYSTGAISASYSAGEIVAAVPELADFANIKTKKILEEMSENLLPKHWKKIAIEVGKELKDCEGVVITHGTDTLSYTTSALSFMLKNLNKPVVFTFAQKSSDRGSSDSAINLVCSTITATKDIAEVVVVGHASIDDNYCFIHRGNKVRKMHSSQRNAFRSINSFPIGKVWPSGKIEFLGGYRSRKEVKEKFYVDDKIEEKVGIVKAYPGLDPELIDWYINKGYKGLVIEGTGLGHVNVKSKSLLPKIKRAISEGMIVCMTTQTIYGRVNPWVYSPARKLLDIGVIYLEDLLTETAYTKLMWVLGHTKDMEKARELMLENLAGEFNPRLEPNQFLV
ncbi:MAG TPA: Glu-tRNA(Gln) amidotransferase subunit GatD [Candidatus Aenigmarchaeota archaeon]|nr:Glu-tRNA(Gln) amidotransferase subunit GatD [Candidatus Aenigmarchaeota archaeon]